MRAGDIVYHWPTGERWVLAYGDDEGRVAWMGWPPGQAEAQHCVLMVPATEAEHRKAVMEWVRPSGRNHNDRRYRYNTWYAEERGWLSA